jgi:ornithine carbamoyltransferase
MKHFLSLMDWSTEEIADLLELAVDVKANPAPRRGALDGKVLALIFQKRSTRTRVSFEVGMTQLGGSALFLSGEDLHLGTSETIEDTAQVLSRYVDGIMARVFAHDDVVRLSTGTVPVINGLSDRLHPCQALADLLTIKEHKGRIEGITLCYIGDGNNVCNSLINAADRTGLRLRVAAPPGYEPGADIVAAAPGADVQITNDVRAAVSGADAVYTDVWASMGQEAEAARRRRVFEPFQVNEALFAQAAPDAIFLHCLPAHRGEEVTDGVMDHPRSVVFDQAENRLHAQKALLLTLLGSRTLTPVSP